MPGERTDPPRRSWRRKASPVSSSASGSGHEWSKRNLKPIVDVKRPGSGSLKIAAAVAGFVACVAALVVLILLIMRPGTVAVVLVGADYADNLLVPHNILGWDGLEGIETLCKTPERLSIFGSAVPRVIRPLQQLDQTEKWDALIDDLKNGFRQETIVIVLGMHGGSSPEGAYLIPERFAGPQDRLYVKNVIESMKKLPAGKQKILVFEGAQIAADWQLGMLHNDFARQLEELEPEIAEVKNLWVLSAADVDQRCWVSEGLGRTVFSHYLIEALRGKAVRDDGSFTLRELHDYVRKNVRSWVWAARGAIQEPVLLPRVERDQGRQADGRAGGARRAGAGPDKVTLAMVTNAPEFTEPPEPEREGLRNLWQGFDRLEALVPHPSVYSPRRWRRYQAELVRFEELVRAGAASKADRARGRIDELERSLSSERILSKMSASVENTFATNVLTGGAIDIGSNRAPKFLEFLNARGPEAAKIWDSLVATEIAGNDARTSLKIQADEFLFRMAFEEPAKNLRRAVEKVDITNGRTGSPQPAEVHLLRMIARWFPESSPLSPRVWDLVGRELRIKKLGERAAAGASELAGEYSRGEQLFPWIKTQVEAADRNRRMGEDLVFSSEKKAWDSADNFFREANQGYDDVIDRSARVRRALAIRDQSLAVLPAYTHWVANRDSEPLWTDLAKKVETLWEKTHALSDRLARPGDEVGSLVKAATELSNGLNDLTNRFITECSVRDTDRLPDDWQAASAAAAVPFAESKERSVRSRLWDRLDIIRQHDRELKAPPKVARTDLADDARQQEAHVRRRAQIQGRLALASLGAWWFDDSEVFKVQDQRDFASVQQIVMRTPKNDSEKIATWLQELAEAGDVIGKRWLELVRHIDSLASEEKGIAIFEDFETRLIKADRLGRLVDAGAPEFEGSEPTARLREARVHDLLLAMADRAWLDHWYAEDPKEAPYYRVAGKRFIDDAAKLVTQSPQLTKARDRLARPGELKLTGPPSEVLTSELIAAIPFKIEAQGAVPKDGFAVIKPIAANRSLELEGSQSGFRAVSRDAKNDSIEVAVKSPLIRRYETDASLNQTQIVASSLKVSGTFRGQPLDFTTKIWLQPVPDTVAIGPPPPDPPQAHVAVRASKEIISRFGAGSGSVAIVLDCSGSMAEPIAAPKFPQAKSALGDVLRQVPEGTVVSLWTFSQLPDDIPVNANGKAFAPTGREAEMNRIAENPELTIRRLRPPQKWAKGQIDQVMRQLDQITPYFNTPLVQSMLEASNKDLKSAMGMKTLLVLTDGNDTQIEKNVNINPKKLKISDFVTERFKSLGVRINMVFFTPAGRQEEIDTARNNFAPALKRLDPQGWFVTADNIGELKRNLKRGITQKLTYQILKSDKTPVSDEAIDVTEPGQTEKWSQPLEPGIYTLRVVADTTHDQDIDVKNGDRLVVDLVEGEDGKIGFQRALYGDNDFRNPERKDSGDWRLAVLANKQERTGQPDRLQIFAALERKHVESSDDRIQQFKPRLAWFQLGAEDIPQKERKYSVRWHERIFYPGPVWHFNVPKWVKDAATGRPAKPMLTAWWYEPETETKLTSAGVLTLNPSGNTSDLPRPIDSQSDVIVESIGVEDHTIEVEPGVPELKSCLVVRVAYPKGNPFIVDPDGFKGLKKPAGYEHRLYADAGKYAGLFWSINQDELEKLSRLSVISLNALQVDATKKKNTIEFKLSDPRPDDPVPDPVIPVVNVIPGGK